MRCRPEHRQFAGYDDLVAVTDFNLARHRKLQAAPVKFHSRRASGRLLFAREILDVAGDAFDRLERGADHQECGAKLFHDQIEIDKPERPKQQRERPKDQALPQRNSDISL